MSTCSTSSRSISAWRIERETQTEVSACARRRCFCQSAVDQRADRRDDECQADDDSDHNGQWNWVAWANLCRTHFGVILKPCENISTLAFSRKGMHGKENIARVYAKYLSAKSVNFYSSLWKRKIFVKFLQSCFELASLIISKFMFTRCFVFKQKSSPCNTVVRMKLQKERSIWGTV